MFWWSLLPTPPNKSIIDLVDAWDYASCAPPKERGKPDKILSFDEVH